MKKLLNATVDYWERFGLHLVETSVGRVAMTMSQPAVKPDVFSFAPRPDAWLATIACVTLTAAAATTVSDSASIRLATLSLSVEQERLPADLMVTAIVRSREGDTLRCEATFTAMGKVAARATALVAISVPTGEGPPLIR